MWSSVGEDCKTTLVCPVATISGWGVFGTATKAGMEAKASRILN